MTLAIKYRAKIGTDKGKINGDKAERNMRIKHEE
jgi:hypothetical protein